MAKASRAKKLLNQQAAARREWVDRVRLSRPGEPINIEYKNQPVGFKRRSCPRGGAGGIDPTRFVLPGKQWTAFNAALNAPAREIPALRRLLTKRSAFEAP